ncbi:heterokaryon incompatibility protein-domain-containing protein [Cercophora newfieldiana]|uniref:Heterokaryon incompatibility protein-domain-containing protein n=1 Tax=Cercophora newfieldiana TaxID=92897 RepID=A0AA39YLF3_9PEZI|nr:heterokaryon incompatibility protein-domain-containing protein [Cercophora newfieldiana]
MSSKLCVFCRRIEPISQPCSPPIRAVGVLQQVTPLSGDEEKMLRDLQAQPSSLCQRCSDYDIINVFREAEAMDGSKEEPVERRTREDNINYHKMVNEKTKRMEDSKLKLGDLSSLVLSPACPVCRLIFRILPREGLGLENDNIKIAPFRSYLQHTGWEKLVDEHKTSGSILLGLDYTANLVAHIGALRVGSDSGIRQSQMAGEAICLATTHLSPGRKVGNARFLEPLADMEFPKRAFETCRQHHGSFCEVTKPPELRFIRVVDVFDRKVVPYHDGCDYFALSYVWGGVMPASGALEAGTLPQTIEDAITVTKKMGWRYLWVDALCIDQTPNPTPNQLAEKQQQLKMMDKIYSSASLTIIALSGTDSNAGLAGVSRPRMSQLQETVGEYTIFTVPPAQTSERAVSTWASRAWTLQEEVLSRRHLIFTDAQIEFQCSKAKVPESLDTDTLPGWTSPLPEMLDLLVPGAYRQPPAGSSPDEGDSESNILSDIYWLITTDYTSRKMSYDGDSLNALLGLLAVWERTLLPSPCLWGLPLSVYPASLGWMHPRRVVPRRRAEFPSWAWAGWEGAVTIDELLLPGRVDGPGFRDMQRDMEVGFVGLEEKELTLKGWIVDLDIRTEPFSEVMDPVTGETMGRVVERDFLHANTLPSATYSGLVISRAKYRVRQDGPQYQKVFIVVLEWLGDVAERKTSITLTTVAGGDFMCLKPVNRTVNLV